MSESLETRIAALQKQQERLKAKEKDLLAQQRTKDRKARTKRLIETGAILEQATNITADTQTERERLSQVINHEFTDKTGRRKTIGQWINDLYTQQETTPENSQQETGEPNQQHLENNNPSQQPQAYQPLVNRRQETNQQPQ